MMHSTVWQCDQMRGGSVYERKLFESKEDAESFATQLAQVAPDLRFDIKAVEISQVWN